MYYIVWYNLVGVDRHEWEEFDTLTEAQAALTEWRKEFPWNRYSLCEVKEVVEPTSERPKPELTFSLPER